MKTMKYFSSFNDQLLDLKTMPNVSCYEIQISPSNRVYGFLWLTTRFPWLAPYFPRRFLQLAPGPPAPPPHNRGKGREIMVGIAALETGACVTQGTQAHSACVTQGIQAGQ